MTPERIDAIHRGILAVATAAMNFGVYDSPENRRQLTARINKVMADVTGRPWCEVLPCFPAVTWAVQAAAVSEDAPPTRPGVAPGAPARARIADARAVQAPAHGMLEQELREQADRTEHHEDAVLLRAAADMIAKLSAAEVPPARVALLEALERAARAWWSQDAAESPIGDALRALNADARTRAADRAWADVRTRVTQGAPLTADELASATQELSGPSGVAVENAADSATIAEAEARGFARCLAIAKDIMRRERENAAPRAYTALNRAWVMIAGIVDEAWSISRTKGGI